MKLLTREQARELDRIAINQMGIPGVELMGKAGSAVAEYAQNMVAGIHNPKIAIICGKGNNAGDGYKAAIELQKIGVKPQLFIIPDKKKINGDSLFYYNKCVENNVSLNHYDSGHVVLVNGGGRVGIGISSPATSAKLDISSTTGALLVPRMTNTQRNALTAVNGMIIYNTTLNTIMKLFNKDYVICLLYLYHL